MTQHKTNRLRTIDLLALAGLMMLVSAAALLAFGTDYSALWPAWLFSVLLWWAGCAAMIAWSILRMLAFVGPGEGDDSRLRRWLREKLIEAAGKVFAEAGFDGATVRRIVSERASM